MKGITTKIADDADVFEAAEQAATKHLHLISNGQRTVLSPVIPAGWHRLIVKVKSPTCARLVPAS